MSDPRTAASAPVSERITRMESQLREQLARWRKIVVEGTIVDYVRELHTATVDIDGIEYAGIPVNYAVLPQLAQAAVNVGATAGVIGFNSATPWVGCVVYIYSPQPPPDPFEPATGHRHTGEIDDGPILP